MIDSIAALTNHEKHRHRYLSPNALKMLGMIVAGRNPSVREFGEATNMGPNGVMFHLRLLAAAGLIEREECSARAIRATVAVEVA